MATEMLTSCAAVPCMYAQTVCTVLSSYPHLTVTPQLKLSQCHRSSSFVSAIAVQAFTATLQFKLSQKRCDSQNVR